MRQSDPYQHANAGSPQLRTCEVVFRRIEGQATRWAGISLQRSLRNIASRWHASPFRYQPHHRRLNLTPTTTRSLSRTASIEKISMLQAYAAPGHIVAAIAHRKTNLNIAPSIGFEFILSTYASSAPSPGFHNTSASPPSLAARAIANSKSESRLRYSRTGSPTCSCSASCQAARSARRHTVRAK